MEVTKRKEKLSPKMSFYFLIYVVNKNLTICGKKTIKRKQYSIKEFTCQVSGVSVQYIFLLFLFFKENSHILFVLSTLHIYF